jgi:hypothetical protein
MRFCIPGKYTVAPKLVDMSGNINLRNLTIRARGKIRHCVALNRQNLPILFRRPVRRLAGLLLTVKRPQPEYVGSISGRSASRNFMMERHEVMSFARKEANPPPPLAFQPQTHYSENPASDGSDAGICATGTDQGMGQRLMELANTFDSSA